LMAGMTNGTRDIAPGSIARKRVRGQVDDAHYQRAVEWQPEAAAVKDGHGRQEKAGSEPPARIIRWRSGRCRSARCLTGGISRWRGTLCALRWLWRTRRLSGHDVVDLLGIDGLPIKQRPGHRLDLVAIVFQ